MTDKLYLSSPDFVNENLEKIAALFPNCVTEGPDGKVVDFDLLKQELNHDVIEGTKERYRLEWPGKRQAMVNANLPTTTTLRPVREDSVDFDNTENLYIEGDNLEVLKILQESYLGKIKMIYIDPPYNTGNDFVYKDNFDKDAQDELFDSGQKDENNNRLISNPETDGRFHSNWLNMIHPRLKLAKNLLTDDGVCFLSIGDHEISNLRCLCNDVFGESNFVAQVPRLAKRTSNKGTHFKPTKDYILVFAKRISDLQNFSIPKVIDESEYRHHDEHGRKYKKSGASLYQPSLDSRPNQRYFIQAPDGSLIIPPGENFPAQKIDGAKIAPASNADKVWRWSVQTYLKQKDRLIFTKASAKNPLLDENGNQSKWNIYPKVYLDEDEKSSLLPEDIIYEFPNSRGTKELKSLGIPFSFSKPSELIKYIFSLVNDKDCYVLDFFSGSASTAQSVMSLNSQDVGKRKYIMVQIQEYCDHKSESYRAGFKNICEIGKERIRRAAKKIQDETGADIDYGFRVYKLDSSNMEDVYHNPQNYDQGQLDLLADNVKPDRTAEDLLTQVILAWGLPLSLKIEEEKIAGKQVFKVAGNSLHACFDSGIDEGFAKEIAKEDPLRVVFKDSAFASDTAKVNVQQLLKQLSPNTEMKVI